MDDSINKMKRAEAEFFDRSACRRTVFGQIPVEADIRRATRFIPCSPDQEAVDPKMTYLLEGDFRYRFIKYVAHCSNGRILDVGCGPGWLALELGRYGQRVDAYDISPQAVDLAQRMLDENPYRENFGKVTYHLEDVTKIDLGEETYDSVSGWSAFHHLPDMLSFMGRINIALRKDGIIATLDDLPRRPLDVWIERFLRLLLPTYDYTYRQKLAYVINWFLGKTKKHTEFFTPMEEVAGKDEAVFELANYLYGNFKILMDIKFDSFSTIPLMRIKGPDWFRYLVARIVIVVDRFFCKIGICRGFVRIIVAQKL